MTLLHVLKLLKKYPTCLVQKIGMSLVKPDSLFMYSQMSLKKDFVCSMFYHHCLSKYFYCLSSIFIMHSFWQKLYIFFCENFSLNLYYSFMKIFFLSFVLLRTIVIWPVQKVLSSCVFIHWISNITWHSLVENTKFVSHCIMFCTNEIWMGKLYLCDVVSECILKNIRNSLFL